MMEKAQLMHVQLGQTQGQSQFCSCISRHSADPTEGAEPGARGTHA